MTVNRKWIEKKFEKLPKEWSWAFERKIVELTLKKKWSKIMPLLMDMLNDTSVSELYRYYAFCAIQTFYRRNRKPELNMFCEKYEKLFSNHPSADHFFLLKYIDMREKITKELLKKAKKSIPKMHHTVGARHLLSDFVAHYYEESPNLSKENPKSFKRWMKIALKEVRFAIKTESHYAKFYYTYGRLLAINKQYDEAITYILMAINKEESSRKDYPNRISMYLSEKLRIETLQREDELQNTIKHLVEQSQNEVQHHIEDLDIKNQNQIREALTKNLEFIGLFSGIIALMITGTTIASDASEFSFLGAAGLIIILIGALSIIFMIINITLHGLKKGWAKNCVILAISIIMLILGLVLCQKTQTPNLIKSSVNQIQELYQKIQIPNYSNLTESESSVNQVQE